MVRACSLFIIFFFRVFVSAGSSLRGVFALAWSLTDMQLIASHVVAWVVPAIFCAVLYFGHFIVQEQSSWYVRCALNMRAVCDTDTCMRTGVIPKKLRNGQCGLALCC